MRRQKSVEFPAIFSNKICKLEKKKKKKNVRRQKSVGFPAIFKTKSLGRVVGHELPWSRDARIPNTYVPV